MKRLMITVHSLALAFALSATSQAALATEQRHEGVTNAPLTLGVVKKLDKPAGNITLAHAPLPNGMPAMTMAFKLKDVARLSGINVGQKVRFAIDATMTIVHLELVK